MPDLLVCILLSPLLLVASNDVLLQNTMRSLTWPMLLARSIQYYLSENHSTKSSS